MSGHLLLWGLLLLLPLTEGWMTPDCQVLGDSEPSWSSWCSTQPGLSLMALCIQVTNVTQKVQALTHELEGLCLFGPASVLAPGAFSHLPGLKFLFLGLHLTQILPGAFQGLWQLQRLSFSNPLGNHLLLTSKAFQNLSSLQSLEFSGFCLNKSLGVLLPPNLRKLYVGLGCLQNVGELSDIFPDLVQRAPSAEAARVLDVLSLALNLKLKETSPGALRGLKLGSLILDDTKMDAAAVMGLELQSLDALSLMATKVTEMPVAVLAQFELRRLDLGGVAMKAIAPESLASCHSLERLNLVGCNLTDLPLGFLSAMPRLQRLGLRNNQLQNVTLCVNETATSGLQTLDLSENRLRILLPSTFSCLPHLRELRLRKNSLVCLEGQVFQGLRNLETLDLSGNPLVKFSKGWLAPMPYLASLSLLDTGLAWSPAWHPWGTAASLHTLSLQLPSGPSGALVLPTQLVSLELQAVPGKMHWKLESHVFPHLETLTLNGGVLLLAPQYAPQIFPALRQLFLLGNSMEAPCIQGSSGSFLWQLPSLQYLKVVGNRQGLKICRVTGLPKLRSLELWYRQLASARLSPVRLEELVGELPSLEKLYLFSTGLETLSAAAFQGLGSLKILVLKLENALVLDSSLQDHSPQMPRSMLFLSSSLACQCANAWVGHWFEQNPRTYMVLLPHHECQLEPRSRHWVPLFPFLWSHCPDTLGLDLFLGSSALLLLLIFLPLLQEARNSWILYLRALVRTWFQGLKGCGGEDRRFLYDVFISYCRQDQGWVVQELLPALEGRLPAGWGLRLCLPDRDFEPGKDEADNVAESMANSRVTLCVLSPRALEAPRCRLELRLATSLLLAAPYPPMLLLVFLEPVSRHRLPRYHQLARLLRRGDYCVWPKEDERKADFWAWLGNRLGHPGLG